MDHRYSSSSSTSSAVPCRNRCFDQVFSRCSRSRVAEFGWIWQACSSGETPPLKWRPSTFVNWAVDWSINSRMLMCLCIVCFQECWTEFLWMLKTKPESMFLWNEILSLGTHVCALFLNGLVLRRHSTKPIRAYPLQTWLWKEFHSAKLQIVCILHWPLSESLLGRFAQLWFCAIPVWS
jgi:hypothetical protein